MIVETGAPRRSRTSSPSGSAEGIAALAGAPISDDARAALTDLAVVRRASPGMMEQHRNAGSR